MLLRVIMMSVITLTRLGVDKVKPLLGLLGLELGWIRLGLVQGGFGTKGLGTRA